MKINNTYCFPLIPKPVNSWSSGSWSCYLTCLAPFSQDPGLQHLMVSTDQAELHVSLLLSDIKGQICSLLSWPVLSKSCLHLPTVALSCVSYPSTSLWSQGGCGHAAAHQSSNAFSLFCMDVIQSTLSGSFPWRTLRASWILLMGNV